jgi:hypothetical protein
MYRIVAICILITLAGCKQAQKPPVFSTEQIAGVITNMTDIMVQDITNPPLAARFFAYSCLAGYEVVSQNNKDIRSMHGVLNDYPEIKKNDSLKGYSYQLSALLAMMNTASKLQPNGPRFKEYEKKFLDSLLNAGVDDEVIAASKAYAMAVSAKILAYAKSDRYNKISNFPRYTSISKEGYWFPTPPAFLPAVEPYFNTIRPFTLTTPDMFKPEPPVPFSSDKKSAFFTMMMLNYSDTLNQEKRAIAGFWDCNPFAVQDKGHLMMALKKISPGAHWMGIAGIACEKSKKNFDQSMRIYTTLAIGMMDAFMCCWDEKFRSNRIRPETAIRKYVDPTWEPLLQTPPFPEYLSGHSVVSGASASLLTHFFGENYAYTDSVEVSYGLAPRSFTGFKQAAAEAAVSRFYGGIHFTDAIDNGLTQGTKIGEWVWDKIQK